VRASYEHGVTDEFVEPVVIGDPAAGRVRSGDSAIFFNFRPDRARELTRALIEPDFAEFDRGPDPPLPFYVQMTEYSDAFKAPVAYPPESITDVLAQRVAAAGLEQLHVAETEKYAHVTYFFDGGNEHPSRGEDWELVDSPRDVPTYDKKPSMSAEGVAAILCDGLTDRHRFALVNFANPDMVGHTGVIPAAVEAVETVDRCLGRVVERVTELGGVLLITADHGNAELMLNADGSPNTAHTTNPVPLVITREGVRLRDGGRLADIAPTVLELLGLPQPDVMTGRSLLA
jgi:2,3-bisphosphoglycerate-independent phosphoglycerate mutase